MKVRIISAIVLLLIFVPLLIVGGLPFSLLMVAISLVGLREIFKVKKKNRFLDLFYYYPTISYISCLMSSC